MLVIRPGSRSAFLKMLDGVEVRALCRPVKFFHSKLWKGTNTKKPTAKHLLFLFHSIQHAVIIRRCKSEGKGSGGSEDVMDVRRIYNTDTHVQSH